jgi:hypothetical protein
MAYSKELEARIDAATQGWGTARKKMFGGTCHLLNGNMLCGVWKDFLIVRLGEERGRAALAEPHVKPFDITGRPMAGWLMVAEPGYAGAALPRWLELARRFVATLPTK